MMALLAFLSLCGFGYGEGRVAYVKEDYISGILSLKAGQEVFVSLEMEGFSQIYHNGTAYLIPSSLLEDYHALEARGWKKGEEIVYEPLIQDRFSDLLFIGDSRFVQMFWDSKDSTSSWICEIGRGYSFLADIAVPMLEKENLSGVDIVLCLGANDLRVQGADPKAVADQFILFYQTTARDWAARDARIHVLSILPVRSEDTVLNQKIDQYNGLIAEFMLSAQTDYNAYGVGDANSLSQHALWDDFAAYNQSVYFQPASAYIDYYDWRGEAGAYLTFRDTLHFDSLTNYRNYITIVSHVHQDRQQRLWEQNASQSSE
ncbi:MAG: hypothetical protein IJU50_10535 [Lachnospiraceae bacterium]|nr:hypothetical protein [Lachnospiraceae bacterium]